MVPSAEVSWSADIGAADWIASRLAKFGESVISVVPDGFDAYARVLHPADSLADGVPVRWREVADWSGLPLRPTGQFHSVALPPLAPADEAPWRDNPHKGTLCRTDAERLVELLRPRTETPDECWFAVWDGYGWQSHTDRWDPPRVHLPSRDYLLYAGPIEALASTTLFDEGRQTPNLWWPRDEAWCVASEVDLPWTYVGGTADLIEGLLQDQLIEVLAVDPEDPIGCTENWVIRWVDQAIEELWASGESTIVTPLGTVVVWLTPAGRIRGGSLRTATSRPDGGSGSSWTVLGKMPPDRLRQNVAAFVTLAVVGLVE